MEVDLGVARQPLVMLGFVRVEVVQHHMQSRIRVPGHGPIHELQELAAPLATVVANMNGSLADLQRGEQVGGAIPLVFMGMPRSALALGRRSHPRPAPRLGWRASRPR